MEKKFVKRKYTYMRPNNNLNLLQIHFEKFVPDNKHMKHRNSYNF